MEYSMFIDGEWVTAASGAVMDVRDPSTGKVIANVPSADQTDARRAVDAAKNAFESGIWSKISPGDRANALFRVAAMLEQDLERFAKLETRNTGKTIKQTLNYDLPYSVDNVKYVAGAGRVLNGDAMAEYVVEGTSAVRREPIGVVVVITPWNYPLMMAVWRAFPALVTGNTVVMKPASYTPLTTLELAKLMQKAGIPKGVFNVITGPGGKVGEELAQHRDVDMIAFTGSTEVGRRLSELGAGTVKKVSLELGGKAPFIVLDDADLEAASEGAVVGGIINNGQDCANSTRYYIHESKLEKFQELLVQKLRQARVSDPAEPDTDMGPLISQSQQARVKGYVEAGIKQGGRLMFGGGVPKIPGYEDGYYIGSDRSYPA